MPKIVRLGKYLDSRAPLDLDVDRLIETRLLIEANSGGGKSYCIRKILEATHGVVQHIVLDMEGEFSTLREHFDYVLAGKGGDLKADPRTADLLARKVLELRASLIVDLYELKQHDRIIFVREFLDGLMNAPKDLWHPVLVVIDEAHVFCPEKAQSAAMGSVIDLATRGRKRGFAAVLATQRLSKLHKDVAAECINKLIGRTGLDIDMKRAGDELGFTSKQQFLSLRDLDPGQFYAFGPALGKHVELGKIDSVKTKHARSGAKASATPAAPTAKIKHILAQLGDLPKEVEKELDERRQLHARIRQLEAELRTSSNGLPDSATLTNARDEGKAAALREAAAYFRELKASLKAKLSTVVDDLPMFAVPTALKPIAKEKTIVKPAPTISKHKPSEDSWHLSKCARAILGAFFRTNVEVLTKVQLGVLTGYAHSSGNFNNNIGTLVTVGLIERVGGGFRLVTAAKQHAMEASDKTNSSDYLDDWMSKLPKCAREIFAVLRQDPARILPKEKVAEDTGYSANSGNFNNNVGTLCSLGLAVRQPGGGLSLNSEVYGL